MKNQRMELRLSEELIDELDAWRQAQPDTPSQSEAVRRLLSRGLSTSPGPQLFELARFQILAAAAESQNLNGFSPSYVYAWDRRIFPLHDHGGGMPDVFADGFRVSKDRMEELASFLDDRWLEKSNLTFYQLEDHYKVRRSGAIWDRSELISACRYFYLCELMDTNFWHALLTPMQYPSEAGGICMPSENIFPLYVN